MNQAGFYAVSAGLQSSEAERVATLGSRFLRCQGNDEFGHLAKSQLMGLLRVDSCIVCLLILSEGGWRMERVIYSDIEQENLHRHNERSICIDPLVTAVHRRTGREGCATAVANRTRETAGFRDHPLFDVLYRAYDMGHITASGVDVGPGRRVFCTVWRRHTDTAFAEVDVSRLLLLSPALSFAARNVAANDSAVAVGLIEAGLSSLRLQAGLSPRETEVARRLCEGLSDLEIARLLGVSIRTVNAHTASVFRKTGVSRRARLAAHVAELATARRLA